MHLHRLGGHRQLHARRRAGLRQGFVQGLVHGLGQVHRSKPLQVGTVDHAGIAEQLVEQAAHVGGIALDGLQAAPHVVRVVVIQCQLRLRAQCGQRRAHLVRGLGHECTQRLVAAGQALHEAVQCGHHLVHLARHACIQRLQVGRLAARQLAFHPHQRPERAVHAEGNQGQQQQRQHADGQQRAGDHVLRQRLARTAGLPDLHLHLALCGGCGEAAADHYEAHGLAAVACVEQLRLRAGPARWRGQIAVAGDEVAAAVGHPVENAVFRCHRQQVKRSVRQVHLPLAIDQRHRICDGQGRGHQQMVVGAVGGTLAVVTRGEQQRHREHGQQRAQIQQQGAPQRSWRGRCAACLSHRGHCCRRPFLPAGSRRHAR